MKLVLNEGDISYNQPSDMLYISIDGHPLDACDEIEDIWEQGITVMRTSGMITGIEIYKFCERYPNTPIIIDVCSKEPFQLSIPFTI